MQQQAKQIVFGALLFLAGICFGALLTFLIRFALPRLTATPVLPHATNTVLLTITATIDGSDRFVFTHENATNEHGRWSPPQNVTFNGEPWPDLSISPANWSSWAANLDLAKAVLVDRKGRDMISLEHTADGFDLYFADTQMGAGPYEATVAIPIK